MNCSARRPCFIDHLFLTFDFRQVPRRNFLQFFPFLVHCCFRCRNFHSLRHRNKLVNQIVVLQWIFTFSCNMVFMIWWFRVSHTHSGGSISFQNTRKFCLIFVRSTTPTILHNFTGHSRSNWCFQLLTRILDGFFEFRILGVDEINSTQFSSVFKMNLFFRPLLFFLQPPVFGMPWGPSSWPPICNGWVKFSCCSNVIFMIPVRYAFQSNSHRFVSFDNTSIFRLVFPNTAAAFTAAIYWCFTWHCCWHRNFQLSTTVFHGSSGSMKKIPRNLLAISSLGFSMIHFCFAFRFDASDICFNISGHTVSGLEVVCFIVSLSRTMYICQVAFLSIKWIFEKCPCIWYFSFSIHVPIIINIFLHHHIKWCMNVSGNVVVLRRNRKWFFSRHVQFDSDFHVMANLTSKTRSYF